MPLPQCIRSGTTGSIDTMTALSLRINDELHRRVVALAHARHISVNQLIVDILAERVGTKTQLQILIESGRATEATLRVRDLPETSAWSGVTVTELRNEERF